MSTVLRIWKPCKESSQVNWTIWDRGDEIWELKSDILRHFEVLERTADNTVITERLRLLRESAIPLEAIRHSVQGWQVSESVVQSSPQVKPVLPLTSSLLSTPTLSPQTIDLTAGSQLSAQLRGLAKKGVNSKGLLDAVPKPQATEEVSNMKSTPPCMMEHLLEERIHHVTPLPPAQGTLEEESSQPFYNHPTELWSSLSQWIPPHALFQPSLHHQATLELSDTPAQTYPYQIDSSKNSRAAQGQRQHVKQGQQSKPYRPKPSSREIELPKRPLFV